MGINKTSFFRKGILSTALSAVLVCGFLPTVAFATAGLSDDKAEIPDIEAIAIEAGFDEGGDGVYELVSCQSITQLGLDDCEHDAASVSNREEPTCAKDGTEYLHCSSCGADFEKTIPALGHAYENGYCIRCAKEEPIASGAWGSMTWDITAGGSFILEGEGAMDSGSMLYGATSNPYPWAAYVSQVKTLSISQGITSIAHSAFWDMSNLEYVVVPEGVTVIGSSAFKYCASLKCVSLPKSLKTINAFAFEGCYDIKKVYFAGSNKSDISIDSHYNYLLNGNYGLTRASWECNHSHSVYKKTVCDPTCENYGYAEVMCTFGEVYDRQASKFPLGHVPEGDVLRVVEPTCTEHGYSARTCARCGEDAESDIVPALGHDIETTVVDPTCVEQGYDLDTCMRCGEESKYNYTDPLGHDVQAHDAVEPTCSSLGHTEGTCCTRCGKWYLGDYITYLDHKYADGICTVCDGKLSDTAMLEIGHGDISSNCVPFANLGNVGSMQVMYKASEIGGKGVIKAISFYVTNPSLRSCVLKVNMGTTSNDKLTDYMSSSDMTLVYSGDAIVGGRTTDVSKEYYLGWYRYVYSSCVLEEGWNTIELDTPFEYDGTQNLVIGVYCSSSTGYSYGGNKPSLTYRCSEVPESTIVRYYTGDNSWYSGKYDNPDYDYNSFSTYDYRPDIAVSFEGCSCDNRSVVETVEPTCTEEGHRILHCPVCGEEVRENIAALGHEFGDGPLCSRCPIRKLKGDVNANNVVNVVDAQLAYDIACGMYQDFADYRNMKNAADVAGSDGKVDAVDAYRIQWMVLRGDWPVASNISVGDTIKYGVYEQDGQTSDGKESISWKVLTVEDGKALLISQYVLDCVPFNDTYVNCMWDNSSLRTWLNGEFYQSAFSAVEKEAISATNGCMYFESLDEDNVFILSADEIQEFFQSEYRYGAYATTYAVNKGCPICDGYAEYWVRPYGNHTNNALYVKALYWSEEGECFGFTSGGDGYLSECGDRGVRPAIWVNL